MCCFCSSDLVQIQTLLKTAKVLESDDLLTMEESEHPASCPVYWVSKWVDYSDKYGLGYQLCDNSNGVVFNDITRLLLAANLQNMQYIEPDGTEHFYTKTNHPESLLKKITLLNYFKQYMQENLLKVSFQCFVDLGYFIALRCFLLRKTVWFMRRSEDRVRLLDYRIAQ